MTLASVPFDTEDERLATPAIRCQRCGSASSLKVVGEAVVCRSLAERGECGLPDPDRVIWHGRPRRRFR